VLFSYARKICHDPRPNFLTTNVDSKFGQDKNTKGPNRDNSEDEEVLKGLLLSSADGWLYHDADKDGYLTKKDVMKSFRKLDTNQDRRLSTKEMQRAMGGWLLEMCYESAILKVDEDKKCKLTEE